MGKQEADGLGYSQRYTTQEHLTMPQPCAGGAAWPRDAAVLARRTGQKCTDHFLEFFLHCTAQQSELPKACVYPGRKPGLLKKFFSCDLGIQREFQKYWSQKSQSEAFSGTPTVCCASVPRGHPAMMVTMPSILNPLQEGPMTHGRKGSQPVLSRTTHDASRLQKRWTSSGCETPRASLDSSWKAPYYRRQLWPEPVC